MKRWICRALGATSVAALAFGGLSAAALGKKHHHKAHHKAHHHKTHHKSGASIKISGPTKNVFHTNFNETVTGTASGKANYVISGEQLYPSGGCAGTYTAERTKSDWYQWPTGTGAVSGKFRLVAQFYARNHHAHGICSYLINSTTRHTYAHASRWWDNG